MDTEVLVVGRQEPEQLGIVADQVRYLVCSRDMGLVQERSLLVLLLVPLREQTQHGQVCNVLQPHDACGGKQK
jgi:hypothetical protein